ncbi:hypothetical protein L6R49_30905, partial [Myxococcota bacterium]|nr:hypothetical protein [Myxococcota bacterium]
LAARVGRADEGLVWAQEAGALFTARGDRGGALLARALAASLSGDPTRRASVLAEALAVDEGDYAWQAAGLLVDDTTPPEALARLDAHVARLERPQVCRELFSPEALSAQLTARRFFSQRQA